MRHILSAAALALALAAAGCNSSEPRQVAFVAAPPPAVIVAPAAPRPVIEVVRPGPVMVGRGPVCREEIKRHERPDGVAVTRREEICR